MKADVFRLLQKAFSQETFRILQKSIKHSLFSKNTRNGTQHLSLPISRVLFRGKCLQGVLSWKQLIYSLTIFQIKSSFKENLTFLLENSYFSFTGKKISHLETYRKYLRILAILLTSYESHFEFSPWPYWCSGSLDGLDCNV